MEKTANNQFDIRELMNADTESMYDSSKPKLVDFYEYDCGTIKPAKGIQYFVQPKMSDYPIDLNKDYEKYIALQQNRQHDVNGPNFFVLEYAKKHNNVADISPEMTNVYSRAGTLTLIMRTPYISENERYLNWNIYVTRYNGGLYILQKRENYTATSKVYSHHYVLNQLLFSGKI